MTRRRRVARGAAAGPVTGLVAVLVVGALAGCGVRPSGVTDAGRPPTGVAPGVTLYFLDADGALRPQVRATGRLGTVADALALLLQGPGGSGMRTGIRVAPGSTTRVVVDAEPGLLRLRVPLAATEVTPPGLDQLACTALGVWVQSGGARGTRVHVQLTVPGPGTDRPRGCPLIS